MYDIIVIGAGIIGLTAAKAMADLGKTVLVLDRAPAPLGWQPEKYPYGRIHAYNLKSIEFLTALGVWQNIPKLAQYDFTGMQVHSKSSNIDLNSIQMGTFVSNHAVIASLLDSLSMPNVDIKWQTELTKITQSIDLVSVFSKDQRYQAERVIAADGARSWVRQHLAINTKIFDYQQKCFVGFVKYSGATKRVAWQDFIDVGTFGLLPYGENTYSLALSVDNATADTLSADNIIDYINGLRKPDNVASFDSITALQSFPLYAVHAKEYVVGNIILAGDSAHAIHPLAGLGLNLGIADVAALKNLIAQPLDIYAKQQFRHNMQIMDALTLMQQTFSTSIGRAAISLAQSEKIQQALMALANQQPIFRTI